MVAPAVAVDGAARGRVFSVPSGALTETVGTGIGVSLFSCLSVVSSFSLGAGTDVVDDAGAAAAFVLEFCRRAGGMYAFGPRTTAPYL